MENNKTIADEPAFAKSAFYHQDGGYDRPENGLTKLEYFASMAMQGLLSGQLLYTDGIDKICSDSVKIANKLIEALNNGSK